MKRRRPSAALVALAAAGAVAWSASVAMAVTPSPNDVYRNRSGVSGDFIGGENPAAGVTPFRRAGMALNPGKIGQWLWGTYYDVRTVPNVSTGGQDAQDTNLQILNTNSNNVADPGYNPNGGIIARLRFRESKTSQEVLDFDIILSCAEVWTAKISLAANGKPVITSNDPIRIATTAATFTTDDILVGGREFTIPPGLTAADVQRGYFEVIAEEALPCEPADGQVDRTGDVWDRLQQIDNTPSEALAAEVIIIRVAAGVSYIYNAEAVTRFRIAGTGSAWFPPLSGAPVLTNCFGPDNGGGPDYTGTNCVNQMNFILSKSRIMAQYDINGAIGASTRVVFTLPTKHFFCPVAGGHFLGVAKPPFSCQGTGSPGVVGGEQIGCVPYNRLEDFIEGEDIFSPGEASICKLPRELTIVSVEATDSASSLTMGATADEHIDVTNIPREHLAGWVDFNMYTDPATASQVHEQTGLDNDLIDLLGVGYTSYRGLPVLSLILQEYTNGAVGGIYGAAVPPPYEVFWANGS